jgi:hypothetical protein
MDGHLVRASSNSKIPCSVENFTLDAERWLAALHWSVRTSYGNEAAHAAANCWLQVFEERLEGSSGLPELTRVTAEAIALFESTIAKPSASLALDSAQREASSQHRRSLRSETAP